MSEPSLLPYPLRVFVAREIGAYNYDNRGAFISSTILFLFGAYVDFPLFISSPFFNSYVVSTFLGIDLIIVVLTGVGGLCVANSSLSQNDVNLGKNLLKAALLLQIASVCTLVAITGRYHYRFRCYKTGTLPNNLRTILIVLYVSCTLITVRTIYRTVEYFETATLNVYADPLHIIFEAMFMFMFLNTALLNAFHPSRFLPVNDKIYLAQNGVTEIEGPGYEDKRHFLLTLFDPFDIIGIIIQKGRERNVLGEE
ncbi:hypothetical protein IW261DRAFT_1585489 [Armillaria novae-zelandiae]|uniref:RTA1 domain protein n=1 Tax=Armillaria novae-zelandiae TaxID=153914 RepID=A0AA39UA60_9AGAR|nr:hypothetical protein IW261DRAFT_1585489 [Armillaria novae-zelandiae]